MSELTPNLKLFKYNTETDAKQPFSINDCMNANWDKLDANLIGADKIDEHLADKVDTSNTQWATNACMPDYSAGINISVPTQSAPYICQYDCYMQGVTSIAYYYTLDAYINGTKYFLGAGNANNITQSNNIYLFLPKGTSIYFNDGYVWASSLYVFPLKGVK